MPLVPTLLLSACLGIGLGALNALLIHYLRVGSIIVTIATSSIYYALLIYLTTLTRSTICRIGGPSQLCCSAP